MNERLTIQDLTDLLAAKHSMTKKDAEAFVKEFFLLIEQALENEKTVKIKGLGTFKLIDVDSRESVNVNTGERFQIKGHTKVSFSPDANLRDTINKPFAHFETVVLNENTILEDTPIEETEEEETGEEASAQAVLNEMGDDSETTVIEENEGTDDGLSEEEPIQEEQIASSRHTDNNDSNQQIRPNGTFLFRHLHFFLFFFRSLGWLCTVIFLCLLLRFCINRINLRKCHRIRESEVHQIFFTDLCEEIHIILSFGIIDDQIKDFPTLC